ncbi:hypothetical protein IGJ63_001918 [Enterococcus sp. DIV1375a]
MTHETMILESMERMKILNLWIDVNKVDTKREDT